ncbi:thiosulfate sulfurtransferase/rhodanese-like domain-containing protein 3 isoform X4 [Cebus imitator]|uniref:thiosulfate sulfurtransferase/rhodanese-like domain-containing protein 3 isoform X4 n=1 Tax=Cebus imitator TaxID=2715852 RepID=UPI00189BC7B1|nr:thiosulfate sulfurtransferase/rhodanese-like domain-containing protein 3 isoform X4 [Cebus imitator]
MPLRFKAVITPCGITRFSRRLAGGRPRARSSAPGGRSRSGRSRRKWSAARLAPGNGAALVAAWDCAQGGPRVSGGCALRGSEKQEGSGHSNISGLSQNCLVFHTCYLF